MKPRATIMVHPCVVVFAAIPLWALSGFLLRKAVSLTNSALGLDRVAPEESADVSSIPLRRAIRRPTTGEALLIVFLSWLFVLGVYLLSAVAIGLIVRHGGMALDRDQELAIVLLLRLLMVPVGFALRALLVAHLLATTFRRASLATVIHDLLQFAVLAVPLYLVFILSRP